VANLITAATCFSHLNLQAVDPTGCSLRDFVCASGRGHQLCERDGTRFIQETPGGASWSVFALMYLADDSRTQ
jgi:hypothetical protein